MLAKFGYQRKTLAELRTPRAAAGAGDAGDERGDAARPRAGADRSAPSSRAATAGREASKR